MVNKTTQQNCDFHNNVLTNKGFLKLASKENLQFRHDLKPEKMLKINIQEDSDDINVDYAETCKKRMRIKKIVNDIIDQDGEIYAEMEKLHNEQLYYFIDHAIKKVQSEQSKKEQQYEDYIDDEVKKEILDENYIQCEMCGTLNGRRKLVCTSCQSREGLKRAKEKKKEDNTPEQRCFASAA